MEILEHLEQEHRQAEQLMKQLADSEPGEERQRRLRELTDALTLHMQVEERFLYPVVADVAGKETEHEADIEHSLARDGLATLHDLVDEPGFGAAVDMLEAGVGHHVEEEEHEIFPKLRADAPERLSQLDPEVLEAQVKKGADAEGMTRDELYEQAQRADIPGRSTMTKNELAEAVADSRP